MRVIPYHVAYNEITGGMAASLLMAQLEYWFEKMQGSFFKFAGPCEHELYVTGASWTEELGMSKSEFRTAFKKIGVSYKSKKAFRESQDPFQGKMYLAYYDRIRKLTYYMRNDELVNRRLKLYREEAQANKQGDAQTNKQEASENKKLMKAFEKKMTTAFNKWLATLDMAEGRGRTFKKVAASKNNLEETWLEAIEADEVEERKLAEEQVAVNQEQEMARQGAKGRATCPAMVDGREIMGVELAEVQGIALGNNEPVIPQQGFKKDLTSSYEASTSLDESVQQAMERCRRLVSANIIPADGKSLDDYKRLLDQQKEESLKASFIQEGVKEDMVLNQEQVLFKDLDVCHQERESSEGEKNKKSSQLEWGEAAIQEIMQLFHQHCPSMPQLRALNAGQKQKLQRLWKVFEGQLEWFAEGFSKVEASDFLSGRLKGWRASFDWLIQENHFKKVLEGAYANYKQGTKPDKFFSTYKHNWDFKALEQAEEAYIEAKLQALSLG